MVEVPEATCRTAASYGKTMKMLRTQDGKDGNYQAPWQYIETSWWSW